MQETEYMSYEKNGVEPSYSLSEGSSSASTTATSHEPIAITTQYAEAPSTLEAMHEQLDLILVACAQLDGLRRSYLPVTQREVEKLRKAFWLAVGETEKLNRNPEVLYADRSTTSLCDTGTDDFHSGQSQPYGRSGISRKGVVEPSSVSRDDSLKESIKSDPKVMACDRILRKLEVYVSGHPCAQTFDGSETSRKWRFFSIPLQRRLQTLVVSMFLFFTFLPLCLAGTLLLLFNWITMPFILTYLLYIFTIGKPKHPLKKSSWFVNLKVWHYYRDYFPIRLVIPRYVRRRFDPSKNYLFVYHPHGIHSFGAIANFSVDANGIRSLLPGIKIHGQTLKINFFIPVWREIIMLCGAGDASRECVSKTLRSGPGESVLLVVGGVKESLMAKPHTNEIKLRERKGFVKIALMEGSPLVPVYAFGENDVYRIPEMADSKWFKQVSSIFQKVTTFAIPLFVGRGWFNYDFGVLPHRRPIVVVVGEPLVVPKIPNPTTEDIIEWHDKYVAALLRLFNEHRGVYDMESTGLRLA